MTASGSPASTQPLSGPGSRTAATALRHGASRAVAAIGLGFLLPVLMGALALGFDRAGAALALLWFAAGSLLLIHGLRSGAHPHDRFGAANLVTLVRLALAGLMAGLLAESRWAPPLAADATAVLAWGVVGVATATALLDAVDGPLARRSGLASGFGARFDMETDAAFILVLAALVWQAGQAGPWVMAAGLLRYAFIGAARIWPWLAAPLAPSRRRQTICVVQIVCLIVCLGPIVPQPLAMGLAATSLALLSLSFAIDIRTLARERHPRPEA